MNPLLLKAKTFTLVMPDDIPPKLGAADVIVVPTDVTDAFAVRAPAQRAREFGRSIDVWVSNVAAGAVG